MTIDAKGVQNLLNRVNAVENAAGRGISYNDRCFVDVPTGQLRALCEAWMQLNRVQFGKLQYPPEHK